MANLGLRMDRRGFLAAMAAAGVVASSGTLAACGRSSGGGGTAKKVLNIADVGQGDPGSWSLFTKETGWKVNMVTVGNAPSQIINSLIGTGAQYDLGHIVGGMQQPLMENDLIVPLDTARIPAWQENEYIEQYLGEGSEGREFFSHDGAIYGFPTLIQGDAFAYLPDETGREEDSYGALFDPRYRGFSALEDNFTTSGQKTAMYLKSANLATIENPGDMTPSEIETVIDFLIEKKKEGQFRTIWKSYNDALNLVMQKEVKVIDCWQVIALEAASKGLKIEYARPKEGYLLFADAAYVIKRERSSETEDAMYKMIDFMGSGWWGAQISLQYGYMTNSEAPGYAASHPDEFTSEEAERVKQLHEEVKSKLEHGGSWQTRWPTHVDEYEAQWARFTSA